MLVILFCNLVYVDVYKICEEQFGGCMLLFLKLSQKVRWPGTDIVAEDMSDMKENILGYSFVQLWIFESNSWKRFEYLNTNQIFSHH